MHRKPITHDQLLAKVERMINRASSDPIGRWTGYARVMECLIQYAQASNHPKIKSTAQPMLAALLTVEESGPFQAIDYFDHRTTEQLRADILKHE